MKTKKMKKLGVALLSAALLLTPCVSLVQGKENPYDDWKTTALQSPQKGKLVAAGDIEVKWDLLTSAKVKQYDVYFDGKLEKTVDAKTNETTVYTTEVSKHTVRVVAVLENKDEVNVSERTFYVSKKGLGFYNEEEGASNSLSYAQNMGLSWYYNWSEQPFDEEDVANSDLEFVPMIYNDDAKAGTMASRLDSLKDAGYDKVLSFNEPDYDQEANMDYALAASYNQDFHNSGLKVGSPAVKGDIIEEDWLQNYWNDLETEDDFITIHSYPGYIGLSDNDQYTPKDAAKDFLDYVTKVHEKYQKPVWITEFAVAAFESNGGWHPYDRDHENHNEAVQEFMDYVINGFDNVVGLDELSFVERYAWFTFDVTNFFGGSSALFPNKTDVSKTKASYKLGELTDLGEIYRNIGLPEEYTLPELDGSMDTSKIIEDKYIVDTQYDDSGDKKDNGQDDPNKDLENNKGDDKGTTNNDSKEETDGKDDKNNNEQKPLQNVSNSTSNSSDESKGQETDKKEVNDQKQTNNNTSVKTGDQTSYVILLLMMFTSLVGIFLLKNKKEY